MAIMLQKGQKIDLTKGKAQMETLTVGLGWDPISQSKGFLGGLFGGGTPNVDCDASVIMLENENFLHNDDLIYFNNKASKCGGVRHSGDNTTGDGAGDDEAITVALSKVPSRITRLVFVVNIYDCVKRKQDFGMIKNAYIRIENPRTREELARYNLSENYSGKTTLIAADIHREGNEWKFGAIGDSTTDGNLQSIVARYMKK